ncbi:hypothetical protein ACIGFK_41395, partial [Streptomyces sp. NPDC085524]
MPPWSGAQAHGSPPPQSPHPRPWSRPVTAMNHAPRTIQAVAARATGLSKVYGQGETQVVALDNV